jgi:hypothetical protein
VRLFYRSALERGSRGLLRVPHELRTGPAEVTVLAHLPLPLARPGQERVGICGVERGKCGDARVERTYVRGE